MTTFPRPITSVHQIELSSLCNLRCVYCPSKKLEQHRGVPSQFITWEHYTRALDWAEEMNVRGTQGELALTGIGEALMHPDFVAMVAAARERLPDNRITFSTNGLLVTDELCAALKPYKPEMYISLHRPEKAGPAINAAGKAGILAGVNASAATAAFDWAGLVDWEVSIIPDAVVCSYLTEGWCVILADGRVATCCLDAEGSSVVGHVDDEIGSLFLKPWTGRNQSCQQCHMTYEVDGSET